jgi:hypothetical protein
MTACGCGEEQIPWMLAKFGLLGTAGLVLGLLVVMTLAGWLLTTVVWLVRRRRHPPGAIDENAQSEQTSLDGFLWRTDDP